MSYTPFSMPTKVLATAITAQSTSFVLQDILSWDGVNPVTAANFGTIGYAVFRNSTNTAMEVAIFDPSTLASGTINFITRGLDFNGDAAPVPANALSWPGNSTFVDLGSDPPQVFSNYANLGLAQTVNGLWTFAVDPLLPAGTKSGNQAMSATDVANVVTGFTGLSSNTVSGTTKVNKNPNGLPRAFNVAVQQQSSPNATLLVLPFHFAEADQVVAYTGGTSPSFASPSLQILYTLGTNPTNGQTWTITINGTAITGTFVTSIGSTAGNVLIGATAALTVANLLALLQAPGTTNSTQVALSSGNQTLVSYLTYTSPTTTQVQATAFSNTSCTSLSGSTTATSGTVSTNTYNRIDLLVYATGSSSLAVRQGTAASSPSAPTPLTGDVVLAQVTNVPGQSSIKDNSDGTNGYISIWYEPNVYEPDALRGARTLDYAVTTGSANAYLASLSPAPVALAAGMLLRLKANFANTGAATLNVNSLGAVNIYKYATTALASGDIPNGAEFAVVYDGTYWQLLNPATVSASLIAPQTASYLLSLYYGTASGFTTTYQFGGGVNGLAGQVYSGAINATSLQKNASVNAAYTYLTFDSVANVAVIYGQLWSGGNSSLPTSSVVYSPVLYTGTSSYIFGNNSGAYSGSYYPSGVYSSAVTFAGSPPAPTSGKLPQAFTDGTYIYIAQTDATFSKFSVSGATLTYVSTVTYTGMSANQWPWSDGTSVYGFTSSGIAKWAVAGGSATQYTGVTPAQAGAGTSYVVGTSQSSPWLAVVVVVAPTATSSTEISTILETITYIPKF